ncbi:SPOR domain-containing protein [Candidatus Palauibacter sp.]|uniref:SPOR domain-containing protein n=1 Tax=Candidatus Palauibacter sp. TaxID=3101350 RepID=UPI003D142678
MSAGAAPFTWELPEDARIVALVFERSEAERSATVVDTIATSFARRRGRTLVLNSESAPSPLDELAGAPERAESRGMAEFLAGQSRLARVAVRRADCPYVYLPAGQVPEGVVGLLESPALARFVSRVKEEDGTLFIVMSERGQPSAGLLDLLDGYVAVGSVSVEDHGMQCHGHVPFESSVAPTPAVASEPEPESEPEHEPEAVEDAAESQPEPAPTPAVEPEPDAAPADWTPARAKARSRRPRGPLVAALAIAALAVGNGWAYRNGWFDNAISRVGSMIAARDEAPAAAPAAAPATETTRVETPVEDGPAAADAGTPTDPSDVAAPTDPPEVSAPGPVAQAPDASTVAAAFESAAERPYSVLLGSFSDPAEAAERVAEIRALHGGVLYFMAPTTIREVRYQRILAGAVASETEASALMNELAAVGVAEEANAWLLRPVRLAYDLGVFTDPAEMEARIAELASLGIPAYSLWTALDGMPVFRVYGGAYENEEAAAPMSDALDAAGESATLVVRRGATPSTP